MPEPTGLTGKFQQPVVKGLLMLTGLGTWAGGAGVGEADASVLTPIDLPRGDVAYELGVPFAGADVAVGRLVLGATAMGVALPTPGYGAGYVTGYGFVGRAGWRLMGLPRREVCVGLGALGGNMSVGSQGAAWEGWFVQPALLVAVPLGRAATLRLAGGPAFFTGRATTPTGGVAGSVGLVPFVPNAELSVWIGERSELTLGGLPAILGWRGSF